MKKSVLIADIETNGLYQNVTEIHCICIKEKGSKHVDSYFDSNLVAIRDKKGSIKEAIKRLEKADMVVWHNGIDFDLRVIKKFYPEFEIDLTRTRDTLIRSYLSNPHRERHFKCPPSKTTIAGRKLIGAHSLENFGYIVGRGKVEHEDWTTFSEDMLHRCVEDVHITDLVDDYLAKEMGRHDWSKAEAIEKKFRFILSEQESYGWLVDKPKLDKLLDTLAKEVNRLNKQILPKIPPVIVKYEKVTKGLVKNGNIASHALKWLGHSDIGGDFCKVEIKEINLDSDKQIKEYLLSIGWRPTEWNFKKIKKKIVKDEKGKPIKLSPKLTEDSLDSIEDEVGKDIVERITVRHRESQLLGWKNTLRFNGRIGAGGNSCGTNTGRVTHKVVVNVPKAEEDVYFGKEMRSIFITRPGYVLVGADLSALENRVAAHYTFKFDNGEFGDRVLSGDPHQHLADLWNLKGKKGRSMAKNVNYAIMYGAQWPKIQAILGCDDKQARFFYNDWWEVNPALKELKDKLEYSLNARGYDNSNLDDKAYIKGIDGRKIFVRSWHSIMNSLFQNAGSIINKYATILIYNEMIKQGIRGHFVGNFHDETQAEIHKDDVDKYRQIVLKSFSKVQKYFNLNLPIEGEVKAANNWAETH